ncbi:MAG: hypothetical protein DLM69_08400 [Candidatus Chloroheliales bacterium]|nr:MAG: hypothetical protein DLM69_08400 [Chloroflexota bacterium]
MQCVIVNCIIADQERDDSKYSCQSKQTANRKLPFNNLNLLVRPHMHSASSQERLLLVRPIQVQMVLRFILGKLTSQTLNERGIAIHLQLSHARVFPIIFR